MLLLMAYFGELIQLCQQWVFGVGFTDGSVYRHDGRADKVRYSHDGRADKVRYSHDCCADKDCLSARR